MSDGVVVVAGIFPVGSVVTLTKVPADAQRSEGGEEVGRRIVDTDGNVGWDALEIGGQYLVDGYVEGFPVTVRTKATDVSEPSNELSQAPSQPVPQMIGSQEDPPADPLPEPPATPEGADPLPEGVPDGVSIAQIGAVTYYQHVGSQDEAASIDGSKWVETGLQEPPVTPAEGDPLPAVPLYAWKGEGEPDLNVDEAGEPEWQAYEGPTEPVSDAPPSAATPSEEESKVAAGSPVGTVTLEPSPPADAPAAPEPGPAVDPAEAPGAAPVAGGETAPPADPATSADVPPAPESTPPAEAEPPADPQNAGPVPSESAGTGDQAGAPSEPATDAQGQPAATPDAGVIDGASTSTNVGPSESPSTSGDAPVDAPADAPVDSGAPGGDVAPVPEEGAAVAAEPEAAPAVEEAAPAADAPPADGGSTPTPLEQLVAQAESLGVANAASLDEDGLRAAIGQAGAAPVV